jgi:hypothetical protein
MEHPKNVAFCFILQSWSMESSPLADCGRRTDKAEVQASVLSGSLSPGVLLTWTPPICVGGGEEESISLLLQPVFGTRAVGEGLSEGDDETQPAFNPQGVEQGRQDVEAKVRRRRRRRRRREKTGESQT